MDVFEDNTLLRSAIRRAFSIWPNRYSANASCLRRILKTFPSTASVSNFKPVVAKAIIASYSRPGDTVVDFCSGYGGRLLGCLTLPRHYVEIEPCRSQVSGLRKMIRVLSRYKPERSSAEIIQGCAEERLRMLPRRSAHLIFSSPPYFNWERYASHSTQSYVRYKTYAEWLEHFLAPVIASCSQLLRKGGHLILNVGNGNRNPDAAEVSQIASLHGFRAKHPHRMVLPKVPYLHPRNGSPQKCESLLVFQRY
jgi:tRNA1(Val) A37 N6-methylase TrmN6